ncbi:hypothetical protein ACFOEK_01550 [Litoribrevibacter euphylliae]|uniref:Chromosome partition protein Smc n=1 Tax=Litoribrevibacter euphylliae TaxID=1834034 RepID=A0ABV7HAM2_9GAMM
MAHDDLLDLKAERDDWQPIKRNTRKNDNDSDNDRSGSGSVFSIIVSLVLAVLLAGMGYWVADQFDKVYDQFERTNQQLNLLSQRVQVLEGKLDTSNDSMLSSEAAVKATLKEHGSEIRKLWGVSYDRNRKAINAQSNDIAQLKKTTKTLKSEVDGAQSKLTQVTKDVSVLSKLKVGESLATLETKLLGVSKEVDAFSTQLKPLLPKLEQYDESIVRNTKQLKELNDELIRSITDIQIQLNDDSLDKEVNKLSKLIDSIDKNRSRVNAELVKLSSKVNELQKKASQK